MVPSFLAAFACLAFFNGHERNSGFVVDAGGISMLRHKGGWVRC
jgi:hypothetical protein